MASVPTTYYSMWHYKRVKQSEEDVLKERKLRQGCCIVREKRGGALCRMGIYRIASISVMLMEVDK